MAGAAELSSRRPRLASTAAARFHSLFVRVQNAPIVRGLVWTHVRDLEQRAQALRALAALLRSGLSARLAITKWPDRCPAPVRACIYRAARRARMGDSLDRAVKAVVELGPDARALSGVLAVHVALGGDVAGMIDALADSVDRRRRQLLEARVAGAGAKLSGRLVAALPLLFLPMVSVARAPLLDPPGLLLLSTGAAFGIGGMLWMERLFPRPPTLDDGAAVLADAVAATVRAGASLPGALAAMSIHAPGDVAAGMHHAARLVRLGAGWVEGLSRAEEASLRSLGASLRHAHALGLPVADGLESFASTRRSEKAREFDEAVRKAPVKMMMPLTLCVLPSFVLLGLGPFLRTLSF